MKVLVTGREGQVARSLVERAKDWSGIEVVALGRPELELADRASVYGAIRARRPDVVVSAAAYTNVDQAEDEPELAEAINADGAGAVAGAAAEIGVPVIHLSTDYVFSGEAQHPYGEADATSPKTVYGRTKLGGEVAVSAANARHVILRTSWVYSPFGRNFAGTMLKLAQARDSIDVVGDQWGNPTSALDIADGILTVAEALARGAPPQAFGIFHLAGSESINWSGFARTLFEQSRTFGGPWAKVEDIATADYPARAQRPKNSRLACGKLARTFGYQARGYRDACGEIVARLLAQA